MASPQHHVIDRDWPIGARVVDTVTGMDYWIDERHKTLKDLIGVIPDRGAPEVEWLPKVRLRRNAG